MNPRRVHDLMRAHFASAGSAGMDWHNLVDEHGLLMDDRVMSVLLTHFVDQGVVEVLVEAQRKGRWEGRTRTNKLVFFDHDENWLGRLARVRIDRTSPWSLQGTLVEESALSTYARRGLPLPVGAA